MPEVHFAAEQATLSSLTEIQTLSIYCSTSSITQINKKKLKLILDFQAIALHLEVNKPKFAQVWPFFLHTTAIITAA